MERILIQPEWDQILNENSKEPVWVQFKTSSDPAINEYIHFFNSDGSPFKLNEEKKQTINIKQISKENRSVELEIESEEYKYRKIIRKFVAPVSKFAPHLDFKTQSKIQPVTCVDVTEGGLGVSCSIDGALLIWLAETGQVRRILDGHIGDVNFCRFFPSGLVVLSGAADLRLKVWSAEDGSSPVTLTGHTYGVSDAAIVERGRNIVSVGRDGQCKLFDVGESKCLATVAKYDCIINACSIITLDDEKIIQRLNIPPREEPKSDREVETENKLIACACEDGYLRVLSLNSRKQIFEYDCKSSVNCCCFLDQNSVACGTQNGYIIIVELSDNSHTPWQEFRSSILSIKKFGPNEGFIATTADGSCFTWSLSSTRSTVDLTGPNCDPVYNAAFNSTHVFTSCRDGYIRKYSIENLLNDD